MKRLAVLFFPLALFPFLTDSCSKNDSNPPTANSQSQEEYTVAFVVNSAQSIFLFNYYDIKGTHIDTIKASSDSIITLVPTGADMEVMQSVKCLDTLLPDALYIKAYMNGKSISNSGIKNGTGSLVIGIQLQSLL